MHKPFFDTLFVGRSIIELERTDSTNNFAAKLLNTQKPAEGTAIMTHIQEAGKGQRGNSWQSEAHKNLTVSFIFYPTFVSANKQFTLNIAISLGLHDYFKAEFGDRVKIKWPNDLYIDHKKVAGILIENIWSGSGLSWTRACLALQNCAISRCKRGRAVLVSTLQGSVKCSALLKKSWR